MRPLAKDDQAPPHRRRRAAAVLIALLAASTLASAWGTEAKPVPAEALKQWELRMVAVGRSLCDLLGRPGTTDELLASVYYDAQRVFFQIANYTGDPSWERCAQLAETVYRDQYVLPNNGRVPGYWNFTTGLRMDHKRTGDWLSKTAVVLLSQHAAFARDGTPLAWTASADYSREVAYAILSYINAEDLGEPKRQRRLDLVNQAYDHMAQWFVRFAWPGPWQQSPQETSRLAPFLVGFTAHSLIRDWEQTQDPRLVPALRLAADWMWAHAWIARDQSMWQDSTDTGAGAPNADLLIAPIYAFLYWQTGEIKYRNQADAIFAGGVKYAWIGAGKQFDQNYWWSFDYVKWRRGQ